MIKRLLQANREQRKLLVSVGANFLTRIPGVVGLLWFLPLLRFGLGTDEYASLLTSMALASASAFLAGGFNMIGRRLVGQAYGNGDRTGESNGLASVVVANTIAIIPTLIVIGTYCWICSSSLAFLIVSSLSAIGLYLAVFDNVRAAYNENYVNAILLIVFQTIAYAIGFFVPATRHSLVLGSLVLQSPYWLVSLVTLVLLVRERPYLVHGRAVAVWPVVRDGTRLAIADGFLMATLSLAVVWLQRSGNAMISAWFATVVRLFQTLLMPVVLLLIPLSS